MVAIVFQNAGWKVAGLNPVKTMWASASQRRSESGRFESSVGFIPTWLGQNTEKVQRNTYFTQTIQNRLKVSEWTHFQAMDRQIICT